MADAAAPRVAAARVLAQVVDRGRSLSDALPASLETVPALDRPLLQQLCYGTLRQWPRLEARLARLLRRPLKGKDRELHTLLLTGLYQLGFMDLPAHAAVSATVTATERLGKDWAKALVNGVLRNYLRERETVDQQADREPAAALAHPEWLLARLRQAWPEDWQAIAEANNAHPPLTLRVNLSRQSRADYLAELAATGLTARPTQASPAGVTLDQPVGVDRLPGFAEGRVSVQDGAAQLAAVLLDAQTREHVLDACAAPGGKTGHILETTPDLHMDALDKDPMRLRRVEENLARLGLQARGIAADAAQPESWWDGRPYDRILLDAPCSATGVIRRHPDIKLLRRPADIDALVAIQGQLLEVMWSLLKPGGMLVYATCSVLPQENAEQIQAFLGRHSDARERPIDAAWGRAVAAGRQILPGEDGMDGFFYACIAKG